MGDYQTILLEVSGGIATLTVNRPEVRNALGKQTVEEIHAALVELAERDDAGVLILTGGRGKGLRFRRRHPRGSPTREARCVGSDQPAVVHGHREFRQAGNRRCQRLRLGRRV